VAQQHRRRPATALGPDRHGRVPLQPRINGIYYINANLPAPQAAFSGVDNRPRWTTNRLNATPGNTVTSAIVLKNQSLGRSYNMSAILARAPFAGISLRGAYSYGVSRNTIDPGSTALSSFNLNQHAGDPNNPAWSADSNEIASTSRDRSIAASRVGSTSVAAFWEARPATQNLPVGSACSRRT
jgi:hypothetical protein